jgi:hypothetical protein
MARRRPPTPETCPVCGEDVPRNALACPECGADHESGWREEAAGIDAVGSRDDANFNYDEFTEREFGGKKQIKPAGLSWFWWIIAALVLGAILYTWLRPFAG